jgi:prepilin-type N-terminal cleavage/methylation domain-containing protein
MDKRGFTLIELLVVISIISLLASIVLISLNGARAKARTARVASDFHQIQIQIDIARDQNKATVLQITGNNCSDCPFRNGQSVNGQTTNLPALNTSWQKLGFPSSPKDPWGTPYLLDENEGESAGDCRYDQLFSAGPNGIDEVGGGDDITTNITHWVCP